MTSIAPIKVDIVVKKGKKDPLKTGIVSDENINKLIKIMIGIDTIDRAVGISFSKSTLKSIDAVKKYVESHLGDELRKTMYMNDCRKLSKDEKDISETDLITILRAILKPKKYVLVGFNNCDGIVKERIYNIMRTES